MARFINLPERDVVVEQQNWTKSHPPMVPSIELMRERALSLQAPSSSSQHDLAFSIDTASHHAAGRREALSKVNLDATKFLQSYQSPDFDIRL